MKYFKQSQYDTLSKYESIPVNSTNSISCCALFYFRARISFSYTKYLDAVKSYTTPLLETTAKIIMLPIPRVVGHKIHRSIIDFLLYAATSSSGGQIKFLLDLVQRPKLGPLTGKFITLLCHFLFSIKEQ